jgi:hypothetical protein
MATNIDVKKLEKRPGPQTPTPTAPKDTLMYFRGGGARVALRDWNATWAYVNVFAEDGTRVYTGLVRKTVIETPSDMRDYLTAREVQV